MSRSGPSYHLSNMALTATPSSDVVSNGTWPGPVPPPHRQRAQHQRHPHRLAREHKRDGMDVTAAGAHPQTRHPQQLPAEGAEAARLLKRQIPTSGRDGVGEQPFPQPELGQQPQAEAARQKCPPSPAQPRRALQASATGLASMNSTYMGKMSSSSRRYSSARLAGRARHGSAR